MKTLHLPIIIVIVFLAFSGTTFVFAQTNQQNSIGLTNQECQNKIGNDMQAVVNSIDKAKAISLATSSSEFQSKVLGFKYFFSNIFTNMTESQETCDDVKLTSIAVEFSVLNNTSNFVKFVQVGEDPTISQVTFVEDIYVQKCNGNCPPPGPPAENTVQKILSPLKQIAGGTAPIDVKCKNNLVLVLKAEDDFPACVKSRSAAVLILHGWARESANGEIVYFMKSNSTGKLTVKYNSAQSYELSDLNARIYNGSSMYQIHPSVMEAEVNPSVISGNSNTTVVYTIMSHDTKGVYWLSLDVCGFVPIAVDLDNSQITNSDLQPSISGWRCPVSLLQYKIVGFEGIEPEYVRIGK